MDPTAVSADADDYKFMAQALQLAARGYYSARPNPRVGCIVTSNGVVVGEGFHYRAGEPHAEVNALRAAGEQARGGTAYVTLEPCCHHGRTPPCTEALIDAGIARVVYAASDPNPQVAGAGALQLRDAGIEIVDSVMSESAAEMNRGFMQRMRRGVPYVTLKIGMTIDAKTALKSGASQWITSAAARADVQRLRAASGAIVTGVGTVADDDPSLTLRDERFDTAGQQPLRVILDTHLRTPSSSKIFRQAGDTLIFTASRDRQLADALIASGATIEPCPQRAVGLDLKAVLARLAAREVNEVLVEAGPRVVGAFIEQRLFDEIVVYMAPKLFGNSATDAFALPELLSIDSAPPLDFVNVRTIGPDLRLTLRSQSDHSAT